MLNGLYPYETGITDNRTPITQSKVKCTSLPHLFRKNGYFTARVGKVFHMGIPRGIGRSGEDDPNAWDLAVNNTGWDAKEENYTQATKYGTFSSPGVAIAYHDPAIEDDEMADGVGTREAVRIMSEHHPAKTGKPLMLFMGYYRPHPPMIAPRSHWNAIDESAITIPDVPAGDHDDIPPVNFHLREEDFNFIPDAIGRSYTQAYYAAVSFIDNEVGKLIEGLKRNGFDRNTIIVFTGDQGFHLGEHGHWHKSTFFEEACRVPLIIADLRTRPAGEKTDGICGLIDLYPTLCELAGLKPEHKLSGKSLGPVLRDPSLPGKEMELTQGNPEGAGLRTERYRYTEWKGGRNGVMLYDLKNDPHEFTNLAGIAEYTEKVEEMKKKLATLMDSK